MELAANAGDADASDRFALNQIQVRSDGSVVATDGTQILRIHAAVEEPGLFDALLPASERGYEGDVLVDSNDAKDFKAACRKALKRAGHKSVADGGEPVHVVVVERRFVIKQADADPRFPDIERVMPKGDMRQITLSVELLTKILRTLKRLRVKAVTLGLTGDPFAAIAISAESLSGKIDGALMPMRTGDEVAEKPPVADSVDQSTGEISEVAH